MTIFTQDYEADIVVPLPFFKDLFETQSKVVDNLALKVIEAERIAESIAINSEHNCQAGPGSSTGSANLNLRDKVLDICKMLFE